MRQIRGERQRFEPEVYELAETLLSEGAEAPSAAALAKELAAQLTNVPRGTPTERAIRDWIKKGVIRRRTDLWSLGGARPGEAVAVLPVLAAVAIRNRRVGTAIDRRIAPPLISNSEASILVGLHEVVGALDPVIRFELARFYAAFSGAGRLTTWLDIFIGHLATYEVWTAEGLKRLEDAIADGWVDPVWQPNNTTVETLDFYSAIEIGKQRRQAAKGANQ